MCGIVAEYAPGKGIDQASHRRALLAVRHRGPDGEGTWFDPDAGVALGHVRLAILDPLGSPQPIVSEDGSVVITVNGEFYGHGAIRRDLAAEGHRFRTGGDSEIALHLYERHGIGFLEHLRGEFALVLWDGHTRTLIAARDRFGIKPLCYHFRAGRLLVASEAKALFELGVGPAWDEEAFYQMAGMQYLPPDRTLFAGVKQLRPGHVLTAGDWGIRISTYWDMDYPVERDRNVSSAPESLTDQLRVALAEAVRLRLRADVPVCCHLSGGLDSATVAALAARERRRPLACFGVGFDVRGYDELDLARQSGLGLGVDFRPVPLSDRELADALADAVWLGEGLAINAHLSAKYLLARAIRAAGFKVVLSGEGSDEVFGGYAHFKQDMASVESRPSGRPPPAMLTGMHLPEGEALPLHAVEQRLGFVPTFLHAKATFGKRMHSLLSGPFRRQFAGVDPFATFLDAFDVPGQLAGRHRVDQASYLWTRSSLANYILRTLGDGTEMAHGVEGRLPFLDHRLFDLARQIPAGLKIRGETEKWILRKAMAGVVPEAVRQRGKQPFTAPPWGLSGQPAGSELLHDTLCSRLLADVPFFDPAEVRGLLDRLPVLSDRERLAWEPVLMLVLTASLAQRRFGL